MRFDEFAANFQNPEELVGGDDSMCENEEADVVVAGTCLNVTEQSCRIDINGAQYEIDSGDIIDIHVISTSDTNLGEDTEPTDSASDEGEDLDAVAANPVPQTVLVTVNKDAVLYQRVPAALLSAMGTWMSVVPA